MIIQGEIEVIEAEVVGSSINSPSGDLTSSDSKIAIEKAWLGDVDSSVSRPKTDRDTEILLLEFLDLIMNVLIQQFRDSFFFNLEDIQLFPAIMKYYIVEAY